MAVSTCMWISYHFVLLCSSELLKVRRKNWLLGFKVALQRHRVTHCFSHVGILCPWNIGDIICFTIVLRDRSGDLVWQGSGGGAGRGHTERSRQKKVVDVTCIQAKGQ